MKSSSTKLETLHRYVPLNSVVGLMILGQFHQRYRYEFFVRTSFSLVMFGLAPKLCTKNARKKRWWNWHLDGSMSPVEVTSGHLVLQIQAMAKEVADRLWRTTYLWRHFCNYFKVHFQFEINLFNFKIDLKVLKSVKDLWSIFKKSYKALI